MDEPTWQRRWVAADGGLATDKQGKEAAVVNAPLWGDEWGFLLAAVLWVMDAEFLAPHLQVSEIFLPKKINLVFVLKCITIHCGHLRKGRRRRMKRESAMLLVHCSISSKIFFCFSLSLKVAEISFTSLPFLSFWSSLADRIAVHSSPLWLKWVLQQQTLGKTEIRLKLNDLFNAVGNTQVPPSLRDLAERIALNKEHS